jgi:hypothetical protein
VNIDWTNCAMRGGCMLKNYAESLLKLNTRFVFQRTGWILTGPVPLL